jgi:hypothetical protein
MKRLLASLLLLIFISAQLFAWGFKVHHIVGDIARNHLTERRSGFHSHPRRDKIAETTRGLKSTPAEIASLRLQRMQYSPTGTPPSPRNYKVVFAWSSA